jgi:mitogen-activated protein kinase organizer 1
MACPLPTKEAAVLKGHQGPVLALKFNHDGNYCLSGGQDRTIRLWNPHRAALVKTYRGHGYEVLDLTASNDNGRIASVGGDKMVFMWDVSTGQTIRKFRGHDARVNAVRFNKDNSVLITGSYDRTLKVWDCKSRNFDAIQVMGEAKDSVTSIIVTDINIITGSVDGCIRTYDIRMGRLYTDHLGQPVTCINQTGDGNCIIASCLDNSVRLIDKSNGDPLNEFKGHKNDSYKVDSCASNDDAFVLSGSEDGLVYCWDLVEAKVVQKLKGHASTVCGLAYHPKEHCLISSSVDSTIRVWR